MNLLSPLSLLWLVPLGGAVIALWILKLRRREVEVPSLYLWRALLQENQANTPFQKLRRSLLLFLQLLVTFLLVFALARPFVYGSAAPGRTVVLILDTSASMNATDVSPSRLAVAKQEADHFVDKMGPEDVATVIAADDRPGTLVGFTTDRGRLRAAIDGATATDTVTDMPAALTLAQTLTGGRPGAVVRVFTDGDFPAGDAARLAGALPPGADVKFVMVGTTHPRNLGITAMDGRRSPVTGKYEVFVQARQFGGGSSPGATLSLYRNGQIIEARALTLLPGGTQSETFSSPLLQQGGVITARLDGVSDDLAADNQASLVLPTPRRRKVLLVSSGNLFLEHGLNLDPDVTLAEVPPQDFATAGQDGAGYTMVVFDDWLPAAPLPPGNYLIFHRFSAQTPLTATGGDAPYPQFVDQSRTDPVMRFVDLSGLSLQTVPNTGVAAWGQMLAETDAGPMIASGERDGLRVVSVAFDIGDSDWPLRVSFPIFLTNTVEWLTAGGSLGASSPDTPTGGVVSLTLPAGLSRISITRPDGSTASLPAPPNGGIVVYDGTQLAGLYHARATGADYPFAVNLLSADASALTVKSHTSLDRAAVVPAATTPALRVKTNFCTDLAAVALVFLVLEWLVFHRRIGAG